MGEAETHTGLLLRAKLGLQDSCNKVPEKRLQRGYPHVVVKRSLNCVLHRVQKKRGGGKKVAERRPFFGGQKKREPKQKKTIHVFFGNNVSLIVAVMTFFH